MDLTVLAQIIMDESKESTKPLLYLAIQEAKKWNQYIENVVKPLHAGFIDSTHYQHQAEEIA